MAKLETEIAVEPIIMESIEQLIRDVKAKHGIVISSIDTDWLDTNSGKVLTRVYFSMSRG